MKTHLLRTFTKLGLLVAVLGLSVLTLCAKPKSVLVVTTTTGFRHSSIETAEKVIANLGQSSGAFTVDFARVSPNSAEFKGADGKMDKGKYEEAIKKVLAETMSNDALKKYDGVIFANTTGDLPLPDKAAFLDWIKAGHAFAGMHSCSDTFHGYPPFIEMLGGEFLTHGAQVSVDCINMDAQHPSAKHFPGSWTVFDEIYIQKNFHRNQVHGLLTLDKHPNTGKPGDYPISWSKQVGKGRVFYTALGHREDVWDPEWKDRKNSPEVALAYQAHILGGIKWALGLEKGDAAPQSTRVKLSREEARDGFRALFNGEDLTGWKLRNPGGRASWSAQNGMLVNEVDKEHGTDLVSEETFRDFTARYEYLVPKGSNSGFYLRGRHEVQILEDYGSANPSPGNNGGIYSIKAPSQNASRKPGEWQQAEVTIKGNLVTVILNGVKIHDNVEVNKPTGGELDGNVDQPGPILLQGDHGAIAFRNIRIKPLK
ncbi:MAG: DUF1080 domain-containing protein [Verrucomicrobia bacterium]|nr:DUF1080 domain-containing protein [Verrucomicrobiota bacterium]